MSGGFHFHSLRTLSLHEKRSNPLPERSKEGKRLRRGAAGGAGQSPAVPALLVRALDKRGTDSALVSYSCSGNKVPQIRWLKAIEKVFSHSFRNQCVSSRLTPFGGSEGDLFLASSSTCWLVVLAYSCMTPTLVSTVTSLLPVTVYVFSSLLKRTPPVTLDLCPLCSSMTSSKLITSAKILFSKKSHSEVRGECEFGEDRIQSHTETVLNISVPVKPPDHCNCMRDSRRDR